MLIASRVTHLEGEYTKMAKNLSLAELRILELCFWLFLVNSGSGQQDWFHSYYFKIWIGGSVIALAYMPIVTTVTRSDPLKNEAFTFLAGSLGSLSLTVWFTPILYEPLPYSSSLTLNSLSEGGPFRHF